ncbi:MAG: hypothetical protein QMD08_05775 [Actinomycetota bacterium]|nr:hypothetical protein [Actinomycetota bacterium]
MSPNEIMILRMAAELKEVNKGVVSGRTQISSDYANHLLNFLVKGGYLTRVASVGYKLTPKGIEILMDELYRARRSLETRIDISCRHLDRVNEEIGRLRNLLEEQLARA